MQPLAELTLTRPWHWGIAILGDPAAEVPTGLGGGALAVGQDVVVLSVRHAQDVEAGRFEGEWDWATATIHLRSLTQEEATQRQLLCDVVITTARDVVSIGDADAMITMPAPSARTRLIITTDEVAPAGMDTVWVDMVAAEMD